jgi:hypothetical protein
MSQNRSLQDRRVSAVRTASPASTLRNWRRMHTSCAHEGGCCGPCGSHGARSRTFETECVAPRGYCVCVDCGPTTCAVEGRGCSSLAWAAKTPREFRVSTLTAPRVAELPSELACVYSSGCERASFAAPRILALWPKLGVVSLRQPDHLCRRAIDHSTWSATSRPLSSAA